MDVLEAFLRVNEFSSAPSFEMFITLSFVTEQKISFWDVIRNIHNIAFMSDGQIDAKMYARKDDDKRWL